ncbi:hypothetical protein APASM_2262 [Actinosynnema pretiosum subsp. pretiosum]|nr:hypothetical protein APASM_2262 [Actinosynnema pretiosum subsp. pretiosum]
MRHVGALLPCSYDNGTGDHRQKRPPRRAAGAAGDHRVRHVRGVNCSISVSPPAAHPVRRGCR